MHMHHDAMKKIILCSSNPLLIKSLYGMLRDEGYAVEDVEHPALAVQKVLDGAYDFMIVDAEPFGLSAEDAARIITTIAPAMPIFCVGGGGGVRRPAADQASRRPGRDQGDDPPHRGLMPDDHRRQRGTSMTMTPKEVILKAFALREGRPDSR